MPDMQSRHCCLCVTGVLSTFLGLMVATAGISFVMNYKISDLPLPPQWQTVDAKKNIGIAMICLGLASIATGILVSLCFFMPVKPIIFHRRQKNLKIETTTDAYNDIKTASSVNNPNKNNDSSNDGSHRSLQKQRPVDLNVSMTKASLLQKSLPPLGSKQIQGTSLTQPTSKISAYPQPVPSQSLPIVQTSHHDFTVTDRNRSHRKSKSVKRSKKRLAPHVEEGEAYDIELPIRHDLRQNDIVRRDFSHRGHPNQMELHQGQLDLRQTAMINKHNRNLCNKQPSNLQKPEITATNHGDVHTTRNSIVEINSRVFTQREDVLTHHGDYSNDETKQTGQFPLVTQRSHSQSYGSGNNTLHCFPENIPKNVHSSCHSTEDAAISPTNEDKTSTLILVSEVGEMRRSDSTMQHLDSDIVDSINAAPSNHEYLTNAS